MVEEIILKEFIASLFKNSVIKKYTDPVLEKGMKKLESIFRSRHKNAVLTQLTETTASPQQLAEKHSAELYELLKDETFQKTVKELCSTPSIYAAVVGVDLQSAKDISLKLSGQSDKTVDIGNSIVNSRIVSEGNVHIEING